MSVHLSQGTHPSKKVTNQRDVKRYLKVVTFGRNGLLVVKQPAAFKPTRHLTVVPKHVLPGLLTALHFRLNHPSKTQLQRAFDRHFFALNTAMEITSVTASCSQCAALACLPKEVAEYSTSDPPDGPGTSFACDILCRSRQKILLVRDCFSSFTKAVIIPDEKSSTIRDALVEITADLKSPCGACIRVDGATSMQKLQNDPLLQHHKLEIQVGRLKNVNKNPIAEKAILELEIELKKAHPDGCQVSPSQLAVVVATLNSRIRNRGMSAREILFQRDHETGAQLRFTDAALAEKQHDIRIKNHPHSAQAKAPKGSIATPLDVKIGDLVFLKDDGTKHVARDRYIVTSCGPKFIGVQKLIRSQFRSREYHVKRTEVYRVPFAKYQIDPGGRRWCESSDSSSDSDDSDESDVNTSDNQDEVMEYSDHSSNESNEESLHMQSDVDHGDIGPGGNSDSDSSQDIDEDPVLGYRGGGRAHGPPKWMESGEWDLT